MFDKSCPRESRGLAKCGQACRINAEAIETSCTLRASRSASRVCLGRRRRGPRHQGAASP